MTDLSVQAGRNKIKSFFSWSNTFDYLVTKQLAHIKGNWELTWDHDRQIYEPEEESFASILNDLINELGTATPPIAYHNNEDCLAEFCMTNLNWDIMKVGVRWTGSDYAAILEQGGFSDRNQRNLILAARGRIQAALDRSQEHFDDMEQSHQRMLANVLAIILYHRANNAA